MLNHLSFHSATEVRDAESMLNHLSFHSATEVRDAESMLNHLSFHSATEVRDAESMLNHLSFHSATEVRDAESLLNHLSFHSATEVRDAESMLNHLSFHSATEVRDAESMLNHLSFHSATEVRDAESMLNHLSFHSATEVRDAESLLNHLSFHSATEVRDAESMLNHLSFQQFTNECAKKLCCDECFSLFTMNTFKAYYISLDETLSSYEDVKQVICDFNGDGETFFPLFYKCVSGEEIVFPRLSRRCSVLLGFEVANYVIARLTGSANINNIEGTPAKDLNEKERKKVTYLSGYVFGTLYRRIRRSTNQSGSPGQYLSLLLSCKSTSAEIRRDEKLVDEIEVVYGE